MCFKVRLLLGAAVPLVFVLPATAQVQITTATTAPVATATANGGAAANVEITTTGSVTLSGQAGATAVTINSNNTVTNAGKIETVNSDNSVGVRITPGITGGYSGVGAVSLLEDFTRPDTDSDTDPDGPVAQGTGRTGILVEPGGTLNGGINLGASGSVVVEGNNSFGVSVRSVLNGDYRQQAIFVDPVADADRNGASITLTGANGVAVDLREDITGNVSIGGSTSATGEGSVGVRVLGDVAGEFLIDGGVLATGFTSAQFDNYRRPGHSERHAHRRPLRCGRPSGRRLGDRDPRRPGARLPGQRQRGGRSRSDRHRQGRGAGLQREPYARTDYFGRLGACRR